MSDGPLTIASTELGPWLERAHREAGSSTPRFALLGEAAGAQPLRITAGPDPFHLFRADQLLDVDAGATLAEAHEHVHKHGYLLPLPGELGFGQEEATVLDAALRAPFWVDAFVQSLDGLSPAGARMETVRAPRAAVGPDLLGGALLPAPWLVPVRFRIRVLQREPTRVAVCSTSGAAEAAELVLEAMADGRMILVVATAREVRMTAGPGAPLRGDPDDELLPFGPPGGAPGWGRGRALGALTLGELSAVLEDKAVVAAPQQARWGTLERGDPPAVILGSVDDAAAALAESLRQSQAREGEHA